MSNLVVMPKTDWASALNTLRAKTNTSAPIKSGELASILSSLNMVGMQVKKIASGTFIPASATSSVSHGLGEIPNFFVVMADKMDLSAASFEKRRLDFSGGVYMGQGTTSSCGSFGWGAGYSNITTTDVKTIHVDSTNLPSTGITLASVLTSSQIKLPWMSANDVGRTFYWVAGVVNRTN